jgi:predicted ATP-dependent serine protease
MVDESDDFYCEECGEDNLQLMGDIKNTRIWKCLECFSEKNVFIKTDICIHEYDEKSKDNCIQCGEPK